MTKTPSRPNLKPPGKCIFCERGGLTFEHIWSEWTYKYLPKRSGWHHRHRFQATAGILGLDKTKKYEGQNNTRKFRVVCRIHCNSGWMSQLEQQVKPILTPLMLGTAAVITPAAQRTLAAWTAMKCMVTEFEEPKWIVSPLSERQFLMNNREPPATWRIWIAYQNSRRWRTGYTRTAITLGSAPRGQDIVVPDADFSKNTQSITLGFGRVVLHAASSRVPGFNESTALGPRIERAMHQIWPNGNGFLWPPGRSISDADIDGLALGQSTLVSKMRWRPIPGA